MSKEQKRIIVYAHWAGMKNPECMGILAVSHVRGKEIFSFEYNSDWLKSDKGYILDPDLQHYTGPQYTKLDKSNFGMFLDSKQQSVTSADMVVDVYKALELLSKHPRIDASRIGVIGASKGGMVALNSSWKPIKDAIGNGFQFALHVSLYGICSDFEKFEFTGAPLLSLIGEKDDWCPAAPWIPFVKKLNDNGYDAEVVIYPGAYHGFDAHYDVHRLKKGHSYKDCRFLFKTDGEVIETTSGLSEDYGEGSKTCRCETSGVMIGQNLKAKIQSKKKAKEFVSRVFKLN